MDVEGEEEEEEELLDEEVQEMEEEEEADDFDVLAGSDEPDGGGEEEGVGRDHSASITRGDLSAMGHGMGFEQPDSDSSDRPLQHSSAGNSKKSRRKRLQRRRGSGRGTNKAGMAAAAAARGSGGGTQGDGRGRRCSPAAGASLTAPFLTWLLWLEHCRRASELETKSRSAARAFVVRAGSLAPILEACFRVLRASSQVCKCSSNGMEHVYSTYLVCSFCRGACVGASCCSAGYFFAKWSSLWTVGLVKFGFVLYLRACVHGSVVQSACFAFLSRLCWCRTAADVRRASVSSRE